MAMLTLAQALRNTRGYLQPTLAHWNTPWDQFTPLLPLVPVKGRSYMIGVINEQTGAALTDVYADPENMTTHALTADALNSYLIPSEGGSAAGAIPSIEYFMGSFAAAYESPRMYDRQLSNDIDIAKEEMEAKRRAILRLIGDANINGRYTFNAFPPVWPTEPGGTHAGLFALLGQFARTRPDASAADLGPWRANRYFWATANNPNGFEDFDLDLLAARVSANNNRDTGKIFLTNSQGRAMILRRMGGSNLLTWGSYRELGMVPIYAGTPILVSDYIPTLPVPAVGVDNNKPFENRPTTWYTGFYTSVFCLTLGAGGVFGIVPADRKSFIEARVEGSTVDNRTITVHADFGLGAQGPDSLAVLNINVLQTVIDQFPAATTPPVPPIYRADQTTYNAF